MSHDPERAYVQSMIDADRAAFAAESESTRLEVDELVKSWQQETVDMREASEARIAAMHAEHRAWLRKMSGQADEAAPRDPQQVQDASVSGESGTTPVTVPAGPGVDQDWPGPASLAASPGQVDPYAAELAEAKRVRQMTMSDYAQLRRDRVTDVTDMRRLFGGR